jgi:hypothetical protein
LSNDGIPIRVDSADVDMLIRVSASTPLVVIKSRGVNIETDDIRRIAMDLRLPPADAIDQRRRTRRDGLSI